MTGDSLPDIEQFLTRPKGLCTYLRRTTPEQRAQIEAALASGVKSWAGYSRFLLACGVECIPETIRSHYVGHTDGR